MGRKPLLAVSLAVVFAGAQIGLGAGPTAYVSDDLGENLYRVDLSTANATLVGHLGPVLMQGLATSSSGQMFGTDIFGQLWSIDSSSGAGTFVANTGHGQIDALHFSGSALLGADFSTGFLTIFQIDTTSGATTNVVIGNTNLGAGRADAMALADPNTLLLAIEDTPGRGFQSLWAVDLTSGAMSLRGVLGAAQQNPVEGLEFSGGTLYAATVSGGLYTLNPNNASATQIGTMRDKNNFALEPLDMTVPEPASLALVVPAAILLIRRRKSPARGQRVKCD
ncbi:MAG TPA: hypothetical protein VH370_06900 [Humisphaera sp.]|nr:hypothetical protein [Humisphaera sp.]